MIKRLFLKGPFMAESHLSLQTMKILWIKLIIHHKKKQFLKVLYLKTTKICKTVKVIYGYNISFQL